MDCCHKNHDHSSTNHHASHGMDHGSAGVYLRRFWIVTVLLLPLVIIHPKVGEFIGISIPAFGSFMQLGVATAIFGFSIIFFQHAWHEIRSRVPGMMTLVSLAVAAGYLFSVASTFIPALHAEFYLEISTLIWVLLFGHYLEAKSSSAAGSALKEVSKLLPKKAHRLIDGQESDVDVFDLREGDIVIVKPGEKVPADGVVLEGGAYVDESLISGESEPQEKRKKMDVVAGSICLDGSLTIRLVRVGEHSTVGQIQQLIERAAKTKPKSQRIADQAAALLTFVAVAVALVTLLVWTLVVGETFSFALTLAITVLVIACPHALGLAIPTVSTIATSLAVKHGFFIKNLAKIETIRKVDYVVFDKTGTLTEGTFGVTSVISLNEHTSEQELLSIAAAAEKHSSHIIGHSILSHAQSQEVHIPKATNFQNIAGKGVRAVVEDKEYVIGNASLMKDVGVHDLIPENVSGTVVFVSYGSQLLGYITLSDTIKESSFAAIRDLHAMGIQVAMITGDNEQVAQSVSKVLHIDTYFANVLPEEKYKHIRALQSEGNTVLMVGDGINDAPALTQADAGVAIGAGTDVAVESGDVVLTQSDPGDVVRLIKLSKKVYTKMIQNLVWALGYNVIAIPAAAGIFAAWGFFLRPEIGALVMSISTVIVVTNAMTLKRLRF